VEPANSPKFTYLIRRLSIPPLNAIAACALRTYTQSIGMIKNLAIKGGGVKGVAYVGALQVLEKQGIFQNLERVAGTSAGSLMALMIACGYDVPGIDKLMRSIQFKKFMNGWNPLRLLTSYGLHSGDYILQYAQQVLEGSPLGLKGDARFEDLHQRGGKALYVFSCNINTQEIKEFSFEKTPGAPVAEAIRASMSIPFFFKAYRFSHGDDHIYVDGGTIYNYPLSLFDNKRRFTYDGLINMESIGLYLTSVHLDEYGQIIYEDGKLKRMERKGRNRLRFNQLFHFSKDIFESLVDSQDVVILDDNEQVSRSILINDLGYPATDFNLHRSDMDALVESGRSGAEKHFQRVNRP
jgi:NTE family protein